MSWPKRLQRSKPLQRDMGDEAEMEKYTIVKDDRMFYPMGVTVINGGAHFSVVSRREACALGKEKTGCKAFVSLGKQDWGCLEYDGFRGFYRNRILL